MCYLTEAGAQLLTTLDPVVDAADEAAVAMLDAGTVRQLIRTLDAVRGDGRR
jgi:hypothetical protein